MEISEVRVKLVNNPNDRLKAFCSITLENDFVVRDLKIIDGANGTFVAMPSRKLADRCAQCGHKNHLRAHYCNECGGQLPESRSTRRRAKLHADIAHPINSACRERIQDIVVEAFKEEIEKSKLPGYQPAKLDDYDDYDDDLHLEAHATDDVQGNGAVDANSENSAEDVPEERPTPTRNGRKDKDKKGNYDNGEGYSDLIAELRRDASGRRDDERGCRNRQSAPPARERTTEQQPLANRTRQAEPAERKTETVKPAAQAPPPPPTPEPATHAANDDFGAGLL